MPDLMDTDLEQELEAAALPLKRRKVKLEGNLKKIREELKRINLSLIGLGHGTTKEEDENTLSQVEVDRVIVEFLEESGEPKTRKEVWEHLKGYQKKHKKGGKALQGRFMSTLSPKNKRVKVLEDDTYTHKDKPRVAVKNGQRV